MQVVVRHRVEKLMPVVGGCVVVRMQELRLLLVALLTVAATLLSELALVSVLGVIQ